MAPRRAKVNKFDYKKLSANDVICPICRSILIKPITLPCSHGFCAACFETTQNATVVCPLCRVRVGSWLRSATKSKKLINETFWQAIQDLFPQQVRNKLIAVSENGGEKGKVKEKNNRRSSNSVPVIEKLTSDIKKIDSKFITRNENKLTGQLNSTASSSVSSTTKNNTVTNTVPKSSNQIVTANLGKNETRPNFFINNFATKEYTCRILCQNMSSKDTQKNNLKESQMLIQKKHKRIQEITESEMSHDRSNSIESECLYFKPIDYRHNPPSEGLTPIKVPTRKPNVSPNIKILAPSGQNQINISYLESAFARLCSPVSSTNKAVCKKENIDSHMQESITLTSIKRKCEQSDNKAKKKIKTNQRPTDNQSLFSKQNNDALKNTTCDTVKCKSSNNTENSKILVSDKKSGGSLTAEEYIKRSLQEKADFELATKLQQTFNQSAKYSTRSTVLKKMAAKNQVKLESIMTPYKVK